MKPHDFEVTVADPVTPSLKKGHSLLLEATAKITDPVSDVEFLAYQPFGYNVRRAGGWGWGQVFN